MLSGHTAVGLRLPQQQEQDLRFLQLENADRAAFFVHEPVPLPADQREAHFGSDHVKIGLDLALAQAEPLGQFMAALTGLARYKLDNLPDALETVGHEPLAVHGMRL